MLSSHANNIHEITFCVIIIVIVVNYQTLTIQYISSDNDKGIMILVILVKTWDFFLCDVKRENTLPHYQP